MQKVFLVKMSSADDLMQKLEADLGWRKKEVSNLLLLETEQNSLLIIKSTILLLYSHWEGFVKNASKLYLKFVSDKKLAINDLTENFKAITFKGLIKELENTKDTLTLSKELNFIDKLNNSNGKKFKVNNSFTSNEKDKSIINTKDNLSLPVFKSIMRIVGINYSDSIDTKSAFIDEKLLGSRNKVAHGSRIVEIDDEFNLTMDDLKEVKDVVFFLMDCFSEDLIYFAENELYFEANMTNIHSYIDARVEEIRNYIP